MVKVSKRTAIELMRVVFRKSLGFCPSYADINLVDATSDLGYIEFDVANRHYKYVNVPGAGNSLVMHRQESGVSFEGRL